jgi:hypothetical protein
MSKHSTSELAKRFGVAVMKEVSAIASGQSSVTDAEILERMETCRSCEMYDANQNRCNACGCFLNAKALFRSAECDLGKWRMLG